MKIFLYSPFSMTTIHESNERALLVLFILKELINHDKKQVLLPEEGPFGWISKRPSYQKLHEYFSLLPAAFPQFSSQIANLSPHMSSQELLNRLEPFILECASNENLLLFLIRYEKALAVKPILDKISPQGIEAIRETIVTNFRKRGYYFIRWIHSFKTA